MLRMLKYLFVVVGAGVALAKPLSDFTTDSDVKRTPGPGRCAELCGSCEHLHLYFYCDIIPEPCISNACVGLPPLDHTPNILPPPDHKRRESGPQPPQHHARAPIFIPKVPDVPAGAG